jgi:stress response protein YsnF
VRLDKETVTDEAQVSEDLRKEEIEVDGADTTRDATLADERDRRI